MWRREERKDDDITWRVNIDFTPTDNDLIYLSATKGSRAGGFNLVFFSAEPDVQDGKPDFVRVGLQRHVARRHDAVELGAVLLRLQERRDIRYRPVGVQPAQHVDERVLGADREIIGWDTDLDWLITDNITLGANFSYTHSEYTDNFTVNDPNDPNRPPSLFDPLNIPIDLKGKQMLQVPEMKGGVYAQYTLQMADRGQVTFLANWSWIDKVYFSAFESSEDAAPSYQRTDLRATWTHRAAQWQVAAFADNVFNDIGVRQVDHYGSTEDVNFRRSGANTIPQQLGISVDYKFGADQDNNERVRFEKGGFGPLLFSLDYFNRSRRGAEFRSTGHQSCEFRAGGFEVCRLAVCRQRSVRVVEFEHQIFARFGFRQRVHFVSGFIGANFLREPKHDFFEFGFFPRGDFEFCDDREHGVVPFQCEFGARHDSPMSHDGVIELLARYRMRHPEEGATIDWFEAFVRSEPNCYERNCWRGHVTGSAWVVNSKGTHVLLTHHRKLGRWLQLGGHSDGDADTLRVACREAQRRIGPDGRTLGRCAVRYRHSSDSGRARRSGAPPFRCSFCSASRGQRKFSGQ